jgi:hypothetical protein
VSSYTAATDFKDSNGSKVVFHSFVQNDDTILYRFCDYMKWQKHDFEKLAIVSEDETAYGNAVKEEKQSAVPCIDSALKLFYPKDISSLRGAYQTKSIFDLGVGSPPPDSQTRSLPTDLADPAGKVHDSIRSYGGNQTPLVQEAFLLEIVAALRDLRARYILLRGSNILDQLFLANFLRRMYPSGRIVILSSDLLFVRERGATGLSGTMTLTNYPLIPLTRDWTEAPNLPAADRTFSSDTSEGTYVAFRVLLNSKSLHNGGEIDPERCHLTDDGSADIFVPPITCSNDPIPDYSPPYWVAPVDCDKTEGCNYKGPATWLTVIGVNRFRPIAALTALPQELERNKAATKSCVGTMDLNSHPKASARSQTPATDAPHNPGRKLKMPPGMKVFFVALIMFSCFHAWWCWTGSYTAKPNFLAHFASAGDWPHAVLVFSGSSLLAFIAIVAAWGCGAFFSPAYNFAHPGFALASALIVCLIAWISIIGRIATVWRLRVVARLDERLSALRQEEKLSGEPEKERLLAERLTRLKRWIEIIRLRRRSQILRASLIFLPVLSFFGAHVLVAEHLLNKTAGFNLLARHAFEQRCLPYRSAHFAPGGSVPLVLVQLAWACPVRIRSSTSSLAAGSKNQKRPTSRRGETRLLANVQP